MRSKKMQELICQAVDDAKGLNVRVLDVQRISDVTDYMVLTSGTSNRHVSSVADKVVEAMRRHGYRPLGTEGREAGEWVLLDFGDVLVHVMKPDVRQFYNLEKLWTDSGQTKAVEK